MKPVEEIKEEIKRRFGKKQAEILVKIVDIVDETVKAKDFNELKAIVAEIAKTQKELAEAQKRTEQRVEELAQAQKGLAEAQKRTEDEIRELTKAIHLTRRELGGLSRSISYAFENEAYRMLPKVLKEKFGIEVVERFVRKEIGGKEVNVFGKGKKNGKDVIIVGEVKMRLEEKGIDEEKRKEWVKEVFDELEDKVRAVEEEFKGVEIVKIFVTHFAADEFMKNAMEKGVIVVQSFEW